VKLRTDGLTRGNNPLAHFVVFAVALVLVGIVQTNNLPAAMATDSPPPDAVELSVDGVHWSNPLTDSPFPSDLTWVPGDSVTGSLWVRTTCDAASGLATWQLDPDTPPIWANDLVVRTRANGSEWSDAASFSDCTATTEFTVTAGSPIRLDMEIKFPYGDASAISVNDSQARIVDVDNAVITLACAGVVPTRPAISECRAPSHVSQPNQLGDKNNPGDSQHKNSNNEEIVTELDSVSGLLGAQAATGRMTRSGVDILRTFAIWSTLVLAGVVLVVLARNRAASKTQPSPSGFTPGTARWMSRVRRG